MVVIEHDIPLIMGLADRIAAMDTGEIVTVGTPAEVQADARVVASYLGTDVRSIERSTRTPVDGASRSAQPRCAAMIRNDTPCTRPAGPDGFCAQHRPVLSEP